MPSKFKHVLPVLPLMISDATYAAAQTVPPPQTDVLPQVDTALLATIVFCSVLIVLWIIHIYMVIQTNREFTETNTNGDDKPIRWLNRHSWAFLSTVLLLPVGLSFVSEIFPKLSKDTAMSSLSFEFAAAVFIIMITLEISYLYNLTTNNWRSMLTAALTIDLIAFAGFALMRREPPVNEFLFAFYLVSGITSMTSSFLTLYHARQHEGVAPDHTETPRRRTTARKRSSRPEQP